MATRTHSMASKVAPSERHEEAPAAAGPSSSSSSSCVFPGTGDRTEIARETPLQSKPKWGVVKEEDGMGGMRTSSLNMVRNIARQQVGADAAGAQTARAADSRGQLRLDVKSHRQRAGEAATARNWRACESEISDAIKLSQKDPTLYNFRSYALLRQYKTARALSDAEEAIALDPRSPRGHYRQARALQVTGESRWAEAGLSFVQTLQTTPTHANASGHFTDLLGGIRRNRLYWQAPQPVQRNLSSTPPPNATPPERCGPVTIGTIMPTTIRVSWHSVDDDGGDQPYKYELEVGTVDALEPDLEPEEFRVAYSGLGTFSVTVDSLQPDTEFVFRVNAVNSRGAAPWSEHVRAATIKGLRP